MECPPLTQDRTYNFSAGPCTLPEDVVFGVQKELHNFHGVGYGVMEMSHRSPEFAKIAKDSFENIRKLLNVPSNYEVLFMHGGGCGQMSAVPLNLNAIESTVEYIESGNWSKRAIGEAGKFCGKVNTHCEAKIAQIGDKTVKFYTVAPKVGEHAADAHYYYYCDNETIAGVEYDGLPEGIPEGALVVCDMSSSFLTKPVDVSKYGVIFAGAQKNLGPAGVTVAIVRKDLLGKGKAYKMTPEVMDYTIIANAESMKNTPSTFPWYVCGENLKWVLAQGGVEEMARRHESMSSKLYKFIDECPYFSTFVEKGSRSRINAPFTFTKLHKTMMRELTDAEKKEKESLTKLFLGEAKAAGLCNLKGHRDLGGFRASMYNGLPEEAVDALVKFMGEFVARHEEEIKC